MKKSISTMEAFNHLRKPIPKCGSVQVDKKKYNRKQKYGEKY